MIPRELQIAIRAQSQIGWHHFLVGRIAHEFQTAVNTAIRHAPMTTYLQNSWTINFIHTLWDIFEDEWEARNRALHGATEAETMARQKAKLIRTVEYLYATKNDLPENVRTALQRPIEKIIQLPTAHLRTWVTITQETISALTKTPSLPKNTISTVTQRRYGFQP